MTPTGTPGGGERRDRLEAALGLRGARLHAPREVGVERRDRERRRAPRRARASSREEVGVARDQRRLGDHADRVPELGEDLEAAAREPQPALDRLVAVGVAGERHHLRLPARRAKRLAQQLGRVVLHHDAALEVEPGAEAEVLVGGAGVAVVRRETGRVEGARRRLDVDDVAPRPELDGAHRLGVGVHLAAEERLALPRDRRAADGEEADAIDEPADEPQRARPPRRGSSWNVEAERRARSLGRARGPRRRPARCGATSPLCPSASKNPATKPRR